MEKSRKFLRLKQKITQIGFLRLVLLPFYPIIVFFTTPLRLMQLLWNSRVLLEGKWEEYFHFSAHRAINDLFYWTYAFNFWQYSRHGVSPTMGTGKYPLSKLFFYSLPSLYAYWRLAPLVPFVGMFGWLFSHFLWTITATNDLWILLIITLCAFSTSFYTQIYFQNYNSLGWFFFPIALFGLFNHQWWVASFGLLGASFTSLTVTVISSFLFFIYAIFSLNLYPLAAVIPASIIIFIHFIPLLKNNQLQESLAMVARAIGLSQKQAKYKRARSLHFGILELYYLCLYLQFGLIYFYITKTIPFLFIVSTAIYIINTTFKRFADIQSMWIMMISIAAATMLTSPNWLMLPSFWLLISPLPFFCCIPHTPPPLLVLPPISPFRIKPWINMMETFLSPVQPRQRIFMAFNNPQNIYENIFDGYRVLLELPSHVAALREIHFLPTWAAVFEMNYPEAPGFWGRAPQEVIENAHFWKANYAIIYQDTSQFSIQEWEEKGFSHISSLDWRPYRKYLQNFIKFPDSGIFIWHLLKVDEQIKH